MKVFLSWSGEKSRMVAVALRDWLPAVIQSMEPWLSGEDISAGARWADEIRKALAESRVGIICLTPDNANSTWVHFEAGTLARAVDRTLLCIYALGVDPANQRGPLALFQWTRGDRSDTFHLVQSLNKATSEPLPDERLAKAFELWWPQLETRLGEVLSLGTSRPAIRTQEEKIDEILLLVREFTSVTHSAAVATQHQRNAPVGEAPNSRPRVFIGSSTQGLAIAEAIQVGLDEAAECTIWTQNQFKVSDTTAESIVEAGVKYDFAILVLTADDMLVKKGDLRAAPRDNILFELGLFTGALGRARTFMVFSRDADLHLPSDLAGVTAALYSERADGNWEAAVGPVCTRIKRAMGVASKSSKSQ